MKVRSWLLVVCALAGLTFEQSSAAAQSCAVESDCEAGLVCKSFGTSACPPCADETCPPCEPQESKACVLPECETDADCPDGTACETSTQMQCDPGVAGAEPCSGDGCSADGFAPPVEPACEATTSSACVPKYTLPCTQASDCGDGFTCEEFIEKSCSGGGSTGSGTAGAGIPADAGAPTPTPDPGFAPPAPLPDDEKPPADGETPPVPEDAGTVPEDSYSCTERPTGEHYCKLVMTACEVDADCIAGFTCVAETSVNCAGTADADTNVGTGGAAMEGSGTAGAPAAGAEPPPDDAAQPSPCESEATVKYCMPPFYSAAGVGTDGLGALAPQADGEVTGAAPDPSNGAAEGAKDADDATGGNGGDSPICSVSTPGSGANPSSGGPALHGLLLLALGFIARRKRTH